MLMTAGSAAILHGGNYADCTTAGSPGRRAWESAREAAERYGKRILESRSRPLRWKLRPGALDCYKISCNSSRSALTDWVSYEV